eukprot:TRINITY_DN12332_c0_g1_i5.p1 TRINITY_DN12332_c0_g1~~TRINITY_DN12332_c0_g1_i5.p1  ORF type:complete len:282 (+),score=30.50 TRINITY_DN12332_c0_g1_i5:245-1090(+)
MFTQWFETNRQYPDARDLRYVDFPTKWTWKSTQKVWSRRKHGRCIGRLYYAHPTSSERYYLRMLLHIIRGATSYGDLRTVDGETHTSFKLACIALGLLSDDSEWDIALTETSQWATAYQLRNMFAEMLLFCEVSNPLHIWNKHWNSLSDDIEMRLRRNENSVSHNLSNHELQNQALIEIESILNKNGRSLKEFQDMPYPQYEHDDFMSNNLLHEEMSYNIDDLASEFYVLHSRLNLQQSIVFDKIIDSSLNGKGGVFFVNGSGGTGKTFLWKTIITKLRSE